MITREILSDLISFNPEPYLTTTLYLRIESSVRPGFVIEAKELIKQRKKEIEARNLTAEQRESILADLSKIQDYVSRTFSSERTRTLVAASCSAKKWWKTINLNVPLQSRVVVGPHAHYRPLALALEDHHRFLVILVDRARSRLFEVFAGKITERAAIVDDVPNKVKVAGFAGYDERRIERHIEDHVRRHFTRVSNAAYDIYKRCLCDSVIVSGSEINRGEFQHFLQPPLADRIAGLLNEEPQSPETEVLKRTLEVEQQLKKREEQKLLDRFFDQLNSGGLGILGLDSTVRALHQGQVNVLLIQEGFSAKGYVCRNCGSLLMGGGTCVFCGGEVEPVSDIVEAMVDQALEHGCQVKYLQQTGTRLETAGIGAFLRFKG